MSCKIKGSTISLTRGDTCNIRVKILIDDKGEEYEPKTGDRVRFAAKKTYRDSVPMILKEIPIETMVLKLDPEDTKNLDFGTYIYDIELTKNNGDVDTFITNAKLMLTEEVY